MLLDTDRDRNIDFLGKKKCLFSVGHILLSRGKKREERTNGRGGGGGMVHSEWKREI